MSALPRCCVRTGRTRPRCATDDDACPGLQRRQPAEDTSSAVRVASSDAEPRLRAATNELGFDLVLNTIAGEALVGELLTTGPTRPSSRARQARHRGGPRAAARRVHRQQVLPSGGHLAACQAPSRTARAASWLRSGSWSPTVCCDRCPITSTAPPTRPRPSVPCASRDMSARSCSLFPPTRTLRWIRRLRRVRRPRTEGDR